MDFISIFRHLLVILTEKVRFRNFANSNSKIVVFQERQNNKKKRN